MGEKLSVYNLGELGVNLTKSPIHHTDGELLQAQNAEFYNENGRAALRRRVGLGELNSSALAGSVAGVVGVPLVAPSQRLILLGSDIGVSVGNAIAFGSTNEFTSAPTMTLNPTTGLAFRLRKADLSDTLPNAEGSYRQPICSFGGVIYYATDDRISRQGRIAALVPKAPQVSPPAAQVYELVQFPNASNVEWIWTARETIYALVKGIVAGANFVYRVDPRTGQARMIANGTIFLTGTENLFTGISFLGKLWVGTSRAAASTGRLYSARDGDTTWTLETTCAAGRHTFTSFAVYKGSLFMGTAAAAGTAAIVQTLAPDGTTYATSLTGTDAVNANYFDCLTVFNGELYAIYISHVGTICHVYKFDGATWVIDEDLDATRSWGYVHGIARTLDRLYLSGVSRSPGLIGTVIFRDTAGTWDDADPFTFNPAHGQLAVI